MTHSGQECPTSNSNVRKLLENLGKEMPTLSQKLGVKILIGPLVSAEHKSIVVLQTERAEAVWDFIMQSGLIQWNSINVLPCKTIEEAMPEILKLKPL
jgi:hypothetical protein